MYYPDIPLDRLRKTKKISFRIAGLLSIVSIWDVLNTKLKC
jgi:hypothetical protein